MVVEAVSLLVLSDGYDSVIYFVSIKKEKKKVIFYTHLKEVQAALY